MQLHQIGVWMVAAAVSVSAQKQESAKPAKPVKPATPITLTGCVQRGESMPDQFTLSEHKGSQIYRLTGPDLREYVGRRVRLIGGPPDSKRLRIVGGLTPTPNIAGQAGAIDPSRAATEAATATTGPGTVELPEFRVKSVRPVSGSCSE
jgi:hypothetical protein